MKNKKRGHYCKICGKSKPNEKFSGGGHKNHVCKDCNKLPSEKRFQILQLDELYGFWEQKNISKKNIQRLSILQYSDFQKVAQLASLLLEVALFCPFKKKRIYHIAKNRKDLIPKLAELDLIYNWDDDESNEWDDDESNEWDDDEFHNNISPF